jgi:multidrug efflux pump
MTIGSVFTLFVVPVFYSLIAAQHQPQEDEAVDPPLTAERSPA